MAGRGHAREPLGVVTNAPFLDLSDLSISVHFIMLCSLMA